MKTSTRITLAVIFSTLVIGLFTTTCYFTYQYHWNLYAFWWSWFGVIWLVNLFVGGYFFYKKDRTDDTKTFWLFLMVVLPIIGAILAIIFNYKLKSLYSQPDTDHTKLQAIIFRAQKSIKIYTNSFFVSLDTFKALNYARWKGVHIQLIISMQEKKSHQSFLIYKLQRELENQIELHFTNKQIVDSFIIIDDQSVFTTSKNFNFSYICTERNLKPDKNWVKYLNIWKNDILRTSLYPTEKPKLNIFKKTRYKIINIFYPFF